jgi:acyl-CoA thioesterase FadM
MGLIHIPRTATAIAKGFIKRRLSPLSDTDKSLVGLGFQNQPYVYTSRAGLFDVDLMLHMNNASYLTHAELARWEWTAFNGTLEANLRSKSFFIVAASMIRFRREIQPLRKFDIETRLGGIDERNIWCYQTFHYSNEQSSEKESGSNQRGKILAQVLTQGVITNKGKVINPRGWLEEHFPASKESIDELSILSEEDGSIFDSKAARFKHLEEALRKSAALYDDKTV